MSEQLPILYSFRRCPYAMRARLALAVSGQAVELREVVLRHKPVGMLAKSPKGTVPVLVLADGTVIDESLAIMRWALQQSDPDNWLASESDALLAANDGDFKQALDRYKYPNRYDNVDPESQRERACEFVSRLEAALAQHSEALAGAQSTLADFAIFPFLRQFAAVDRDWWAQTPYRRVRAWLQAHLDSDLFARIMRKRDAWQPGDPAEIERWTVPDKQRKAA